MSKSFSTNTNFLNITEAAEKHFSALLQEEPAGTNIKLGVLNPGTPQAELSVNFCATGEEEKTDVPVVCTGYTIFVEQHAVEALKEAKIDFIADITGGQLSIKAPYLRGKALVEAGGTLRERVQHVIDTEIIPGLAMHNGYVSIVDVLDNGIVILQFGGGCHGCTMANFTLKQGIERTLKERFPEILEVRDVTDHSVGSNPYY